MLLVWLGEAIRPTRDADLLGFGDINVQTLSEIFNELCVMEVEPDGLEFEATSLRVAPIRVEDAYGGQRATPFARLGAARLKYKWMLESAMQSSLIHRGLNTPAY